LGTLASGGAAIFELLQALGLVALRLWKAIRRLRLIELQRSMVHPQGARCVFPRRCFGLKLPPARQNTW
jgi:hypothetical protein